MTQHWGTPDQSGAPEAAALQDAYGRGYLDGHLAGWRDALAAQAAQAASAPDIPGGAGTRQPPAVQPRADMQPGTGAAPTSGNRPPGIMPEPAQRLAAGTPWSQPPPRFPAVRAGGPAPTVPVPLAGAVPAPARPASPGQAPPVPRPAGPALHQPIPARAGPEAVAARKARRESQNINITLYVASLLMVAAAALFVGSSQPVPVRLGGVWLATALFYGTGLVLHGRVARLKPAAVAFTGTALAIIPCAGLATYNLGFPDAPAVWFATSLIGTAAYVFAALKLHSRLVVYLSLAFVLSTAWSSVAVLGAALAWYFAALIVVSALLSLAGHLMRNREGGAGIYAKPLADLGPCFAPAGLAGSLIFSLSLNAADHLLVLAAGTIYYAVMSAICAPALRRWNFLGLRLSVTLASPFMGWLVQPDLAGWAGAFTLVLAAQAVAVAHGHRQLSAFLHSSRWVAWDVTASVWLLSAVSLAWTLGRAGSGDAFAGLGLAVGLAAAMAMVPAVAPKGEWLPLPLAALAVMCTPALSALDAMVLTALGTAYCLLRHVLARNTALGDAMLILARVLATAFVAGMLAQVLPPEPGKSYLVIAATAVLAALQLLADTMLGRLGAANAATKYSAAGWAAAGTVLVVLLAGAYADPANFALLGAGTLDRPSSAPPAVLRMEFLVSAAAMGLAAAGYSLSKLPRTRGWSLAEAVSPSYLAIAAVSTGAVFGAAGSSTAWGLVLGYLVSAGALLRRQEGGRHRWAYWRAARAVSLLLAVSLFSLWHWHDPATVLLGSSVGVGSVLLLVLVPQLVILAVASARRWAVGGLPVDAAVTLAAVVIASVPWMLSPEPGLWTARAAVVLAALAMSALAVCGTMKHSGKPLPSWAVPCAMALVSLLQWDDRPLVAAVLAVLSASSALLAGRAVDGLLRGMHFLIARVAVTLLAAVVVREVSGSPEVNSLAMAGMMLLQLALSRLAVRPGRLNAAVGATGLLRVGLWMTLGAQVLLPATYAAMGGGFAPAGRALRWVVAVELVALAGSAVAAQLRMRQRGASYLAILAVVGGAVVIAPVLWPGTTALILLGLSLAVIAWRCVHEPAGPEMRWYWLVASGSFLTTAVLVDRDAPEALFGAVWLLAGAAFLLAAHQVKLPQLTLPGSLMVLLSAFLFRSQTQDAVSHDGYASLVGFMVVVGALYLVRLLLVGRVASPHLQRGALAGVALGGGALFAAWAMLDDSAVFWGAAAFTSVAALCCMEAPARYRGPAMDAAVVAGALVWYWACSRYVDLGLFWFVQWCAFALAALAVRRYRAGLGTSGRGMLMAAAAAASLGGVLTIASGETVQQLVSLLVFVALLAVGMSLDERVFTVWGAAGVATAVIWYLRGYTYVLLALLALALIGLVIWRLNRKKPQERPASPPHAPPAGARATGPGPAPAVPDGGTVSAPDSPHQPAQGLDPRQGPGTALPQDLPVQPSTAPYRDMPPPL